jgi:co-chaperonin GroES (HSP10)
MLTKNSIALNKNVLIEIIEQKDKRCHMDGIYLPESVTINKELIKGRVISVGIEAQNETGLKPDDIVLYDRWSVFSHSAGLRECTSILPGTIVLTASENIIGIVTE